MNTTFAAMAIFLAAAGLVTALASLLRDWRRAKPAEPMLGQDGQPIWIERNSPLLGGRPSGRIDRAFVRLVEESGSPFDVPTALSIVAGAAVLGCAAPLLLLENFLAAAAGLVIDAMLPIAWWSVRREWRMHKLQKHLPETLELLADGLRAGQTLEQAAAMLAEDAPEPLAEEFGHCASQLALGHSPTAVLERMARRIPLPEFRTFATAALVHRRTGGNLALLAQRLAASARDRSEFHGHARAVTAASRLSVIGITVGSLVAVSVLASIRSDYLAAFVRHPFGPPLLVLAGILQLTGILWVWRTLKISY
ncbi:MAG: type II secretion system F family protein [Pirellulales bacterium]|nr:type II secretion system F family protein [Pirellulales bacterium]